MKLKWARIALVGGVAVAALGASAPAALAQDATAGRTTFINTGCGSCHTFAAAGATGTISTNFDQQKPTFARAVQVVTNGITSAAGTMPAYQGVLSAAEIQNVAAFVSGRTQQTPPPPPPAPAPAPPPAPTPSPTPSPAPAPSPAPSPSPAPAPAPAPPPPPGALPATGYDMTPILLLAAGVSAIGLALVFWRPRRKGTHS